MRILVLGAGGIGGYFGGRMAESGADVTFLVRPKRREQLRRGGLIIESPVGNAKIGAKAIESSELQPGYDLVLFTCKAYDLDSAIEAIAPAMQPGCVVLPLLNGLAHLDRLDARFGAANVLGGTCQIDVTLRRGGIVHHLSPLNRLIFGERSAAQAERAKQFAAVLGKTSIESTHSQDVVQDLWEKIVFLATLAATTCLLRANVGEIVAAEGGKAIVERCLEANVAIAKREKHAPRAEVLAWARERLTEPGSGASASMLRDLENGNPVEAEHIIGDMLARARKHKLDDTVLAIAYAHLKAYEARRAAGRLPGADRA